MKYRIFQHINGKSTDLGFVLAKNSPQAVLKAYKKYKVPAERQRYIGARPVVVTQKPSMPISPEEREIAQKLLNGFRSLMK